MSGVTMLIQSGATATVADGVSGRSGLTLAAPSDPFFSSFVRAASNVLKFTVTATDAEAQQIQALVAGAQRQTRS